MKIGLLFSSRDNFDGLNANLNRLSMDFFSRFYFHVRFYYFKYVIALGFIKMAPTLRFVRGCNSGYVQCMHDQLLIDRCFKHITCCSLGCPIQQKTISTMIWLTKFKAVKKNKMFKNPKHAWHGNKNNEMGVPDNQIVMEKKES